MGALATIKYFRPLFRRIPDGNGGLTSDERLAIDAEELYITGCIGEPMFGDPRKLTTDPLLREWIEGLRRGGRDG